MQCVTVRGTHRWRVWQTLHHRPVLNSWALGVLWGQLSGLRCAGQTRCPQQFLLAWESASVRQRAAASRLSRQPLSAQLEQVAVFSRHSPCSGVPSVQPIGDGLSSPFSAAGKAGQCPAGRIEFVRPSRIYCLSDWSCPGSEKCCNTGHMRTCLLPDRGRSSSPGYTRDPLRRQRGASKSGAAWKATNGNGEGWTVMHTDRPYGRVVGAIWRTMALHDCFTVWQESLGSAACLV